MDTLRGIHSAHVTRIQIRWYCSYSIFSQSIFPTQYDRLHQQQLGFLFSSNQWTNQSKWIICI